MPNLVDIPHELHLHLLPFLDYPSYFMLRATNQYFRSLNLKPELILDKLIHLEMAAPTKSTFLTERDILPCYWCPVLTGPVGGVVALRPTNRFKDGMKIMTSAPKSLPTKKIELYRRCIDCLAKYITGYGSVMKGVNEQSTSLTLFGISCVGGDCAHCVRTALRVSGCSEGRKFRVYNRFLGPFFPSMHTGCRSKGYCWTCLKGPRPGNDASPAQIWRRECDDCFEKRLGRKRKYDVEGARSVTQESSDWVIG